jgi:enoyl-CoA hydratase
MADDELLYQVTDGVARITINRPERRNALSWALVGRLRAAFADAKADDAVRVCVLTGAGDRAFCAGADLSGMAKDAGGGAGGRGEDAGGGAGGHGAGAGFVALHDARGELAGLFRDLYALGKPTIARVRGYALAGGFGLALTCDMVVAADDAVFGAPEINVGLWPYMVTVPMLRAMPTKLALELSLTGRRVAADEAQRIGFVNRVVPVDRLDDEVDELATALAAKSPTAMRLGRDAFYAVWDQDVDTALSLLHPLLSLTAASEDAAEGIAAFHEKRPPRFTGR